MAETIEEFVSKLQKEGVQAGQDEASRIRQQAEQDAEKIRAEAKAEAEKIVSEANKEAESLLARSRTDLDLAARDVVLKLREALGQVLKAVLAAGADEKLQDVEFLGNTLHELILLYAKSDCEKKGRMEIDVPEEIRQQLTEWALREIGKDKIEGLNVSLDLKGTLKQAGFEYNVTGATVEFTRDSVVESLMEMVSPSLREVVARAMSEGQDAGPDAGDQNAG